MLKLKNQNMYFELKCTCAYKRAGSFGLDCCAKPTNAAGKATSVGVSSLLDVCDGFDVGSFV